MAALSPQQIEVLMMSDRDIENGSLISSEELAKSDMAWLKWKFSEINERINLLHAHPKLGRETDFKNTRVLSMGYYNIFYKALDEGIIVTAFWDTRQDPEKLLQLLK